MRQSLGITPKKSLVMTFQMKEALQILQMPQQELSAYLQEQIEKNPLLCEVERSEPKIFEKELEAKVSIYDHLEKQIQETFLNERDRQIAMGYFQQLDEKGFLSDLKPSSGSDRILKILQTLDPPGIFAKNLQECFLLQLNPESEAYFLVRDHFEDLLHQRYSKLNKKYKNLSKDLDVLSQLRTRPIEAFDKGISFPIIPDLSFEKQETGWEIRVLNEEIPLLFLNPKYQNTAKTNEEQKTLSNWIAHGKGLISSLSRRKEILLQIGIKIVQRQAQYLLQGGPLAPLTIEELCEALGVHESTISRALSGKYAETPRGVISLRSLISSCPEKIEAKEILQKLIFSENKSAPFSDEDLASQLEKKGHRIARRTVSKYRKELKIQTAKKRKIFNKK